MSLLGRFGGVDRRSEGGDIMLARHCFDELTRRTEQIRPWNRGCGRSLGLQPLQKGRNIRVGLVKERIGRCPLSR